MSIIRRKRMLGWRPASLLLAGLASASSCSASLLIDLDASQLPPGPLNSWTNAGSIGDSFVVPTNATIPSVASVDGVNAVMFLKNGAAAGTHYFGPEVPATLTGAGLRTVEAWIHNPTPQPEETIVAWGRRADSANMNRNFEFGEGRAQALDERQAQGAGCRDSFQDHAPNLASPTPTWPQKLTPALASAAVNPPFLLAFLPVIQSDLLDIYPTNREE